MKTRMVFVAGAVAAVLVFAGTVPASAKSAADQPALVAAPDDGTNGALDGPAVIVTSGGGDGSVGGVSLYAVTVCEPNVTSYVVPSSTRSGQVTTWHKHVKNDATSETLSITTSNTVSIKATASVSGSLSGSVAIKKIAEVALGITGNYGLEGSYASTTGFTRSATFTSAGKWILYAGVYTGSGTVKKNTCNSSGTAISTSTGTASTYNNARTTGLVNCANSVSDLVAVNAKTKCG